MIYGKVNSYTTRCGGRIHKGWVIVSNETLSPLDVLGPQIPDPEPRHKREFVKLGTNKARTIGWCYIIDIKR
jgi:hypothetical protein